MGTIQRARSGSLAVAWWLAGLGAIAVAAALYVWLLHLTTYDDHQLPLLRSLASADLVHALEGAVPQQTSGPGFGLFALAVFALARLWASDQGAYGVASLSALVPLAWALVAASRALGVERRSVRELASVAVVVLGTPTMANYIEALHPADVLATAACLGAFAALASRRVPWAFVLLGFALVTRQWAILAVAVLAGLCAWLVRRRVAWSPEVAVAALAVAFLIRPPFDPAGYLYFDPGYACFVLMGPKTWRWLAAGVAGSVALLLRFSVRDRFPYARVVSVFGVEGPFRAPGVALSIATTLTFLAALVAAVVHLRTLVGRQAARSSRLRPTSGRPGPMVVARAR